MQANPGLIRYTLTKFFREQGLITDRLAKTDRLVRCVGRLSGKLLHGSFPKDRYLREFYESLGIKLCLPETEYDKKYRYLKAINNLSCTYCGETRRLSVNHRDLVVCQDCDKQNGRAKENQPKESADY